MAKKNNLVVGLDIGTSKICAVVGEMREQGVEVVGVGTHPSQGLRKGVVINIESTVNSIKKAIEEGEKEEDIRRLAEDLETTFEDLKITISNLHEINPMLGHRGCRLGITFPDIYRMQAQAISEAAIEVSAGGMEVNVEFEIPLVGFDTELKNLRKLVEETVLSY